MIFRCRPVHHLARSKSSTFPSIVGLHFHHIFGRPLFLFPGIGLSVANTFLSRPMCSSSLIITCCYQFDIPSMIFFEACATLVVPRKCSLQTLSLRVDPYIHLIIIMSFTLIPSSCFFVVANVYAPMSLLV